MVLMCPRACGRGGTSKEEEAVVALLESEGTDEAAVEVVVLPPELEEVAFLVLEDRLDREEEAEACFKADNGSEDTKKEETKLAA
jgi:hypothetical protein